MIKYVWLSIKQEYNFVSELQNLLSHNADQCYNWSKSESIIDV